MKLIVIATKVLTQYVGHQFISLDHAMFATDINNQIVTSQLYVETVTLHSVNARESAIITISKQK